jgi:hypothetical protein
MILDYSILITNIWPHYIPRPVISHALGTNIHPNKELFLTNTKHRFTYATAFSFFDVLEYRILLNYFLANSSTQKPEKFSYETSVDFRRITERHIRRDTTLHSHRCEYLKSNIDE